MLEIDFVIDMGEKMGRAMGKEEEMERRMGNDGQKHSGRR